MSLTTAKEYFAILVVIAQNEANNVGAMARKAAIHSIIDLALIYDHELTKDLDTTQLESILQSTANESTWGDTAINASSVIEDGPQVQHFSYKEGGQKFVQLDWRPIGNPSELDLIGK